MLHPNQFEVDEAWIAFQLNDAPLITEKDGALNCVALMDAASCFILASAFVIAGAREMPKLEARRLLKQGRAHNQVLPKTLFIPSEYPADNLAQEAGRQKVAVVRVPEEQLAVFIAEARESFKEYLGVGRLQ